MALGRLLLKLGGRLSAIGATMIYAAERGETMNMHTKSAILSAIGVGFLVLVVLGAILGGLPG